MSSWVTKLQESFRGVFSPDDLVKFDCLTASVQYVAQFSYGPSFRTKRTLFDYFRRSFKSSSTEEFQK